MSLEHLDEEDRKYVESCLANNIPLDQAMAQLEVLREEHMQRLFEKCNLSRDQLIQSEIDAITGGNEQEWREECNPSCCEIAEVEKLKRMMIQE